MAVYGAPVAHEDDAQRAVFSALRIPPVIEELNETNHDLPLAVRIGIETGVAVVSVGAESSEQGIAIGDVVNTASRLQGVAPIGGILVGEGTYRLTRDLFDYEPLDPVQVKGKAEALPVWVAKAARSRFGTEVQRRPSTPFVGREDELELLKHTFARAAREPSVQLVTLLGEPGVGKSRMLGELFSHLDDQPELVTWRQGRCLPYGEGVTYLGARADREGAGGHPRVRRRRDRPYQALRLRRGARRGRRRARVAPGPARAAGWPGRPAAGPGRADGSLQRVAPFPRGDRVDPPPRDRDRGPPLGASRDGRVRRARARVVGRFPDADRVHRETRDAATRPAVGRRDAQLGDGLARPPERRGDPPAPGARPAARDRDPTSAT